MASVTEIGFAGVALHKTRIRQTPVKLPAVEFKLSVVFPHHLLSPVNQQLHVGTSHEIRRFHALRLVFRQFEIRHGSRTGCEIVGKGNRDESQEYQQAQIDEASITHGLSLLLIVPLNLRANQWFVRAHL